MSNVARRRAELEAEVAAADAKARSDFEKAEQRVKERKASERKVYLQTLQNWGPLLFLGPLIPAFGAVVSICAISVISNIDAKNNDGTLCNSGILNTYMLASQVLAYIFLFGYGCMFIGSQIDCCNTGYIVDCACHSLRSIWSFYLMIFVAGLGVNGLGAFAVQSSYVCAEPDATPYAYNLSLAMVIFFWLCAIVAISYGVWYFAKKRAERIALQRKLQAELDAEWEAEEALRLQGAIAAQEGQDDWFAQSTDENAE